MADQPLSISVVMPVRDEAGFIAATINQLLAQDYPADLFEVLVCDGGSGDGTLRIVREIMARNANVRLIENPLGRSSAGRNVGFRYGGGDVFLVIDGHCHIPDDTLLRNVDRLFRQTDAACLGRPQHLDPPGLTAFQRSVALARSSWLGHGSDSLIYGQYEGYASPVSNGAAYRREVFEHVGYVDESFDACEDVEFNWRVEQAGFKSFTSPSLMVQYYPREALGGLWRQMLRYGRGRVRLVRKHPAAFKPSLAVPVSLTATALVYLFALAVWALSASPVPLLEACLAWMSLGTAFYAVIILGESLRLSLGHGLEHLFRLLLIFPAIHLGLGIGMLLEFFSPAGGKQP